MTPEEEKAFEQLNTKLDELQRTIEKAPDPELANNHNILKAIDDLQETIKPSNLSNWQKITKVDWSAGVKASIATVEGLIEAINIFTDPQKDWHDKTAIVLTTIGSAIEILSALPVVGVAFTVIGGLFKIVGTAFGFFGAPSRSKEDIYFEALTGMVNEAVDRAATEQINQELKGALMRICTLKRLVSDVNSNHLFKRNSKNFPDLNVTLFATAGDEALGAAIQHLEYSVQDLTKTIAALNLQTFYYTFDLFVEKYQLIVQGITYFFWVETADAEAKSESKKFDPEVYKDNYEVCNRTTLLLNYLYEQYAKVFGEFLGAWFVKPDLSHAALTTRIYAGDHQRFKIIAQQAVLFDASAWPVGFSPENAGNFFRMTTISEFRGKELPGNTHALRGFLCSDKFRLLEDNKWLTDNGYSSRVYLHYDEGAKKKGEAVHYWELRVFNADAKTYLSKNPVYLFYVYPTPTEIEKFFPYDEGGIRTGRTAIMGIPGTNKVYGSEITKEADDGDHAQEAQMVEYDYIEGLFYTINNKNHKHYCTVWTLDDFKSGW